MATKRPEQWKDEDLDVIMSLLEKDYTKAEPEKMPELQPRIPEDTVPAEEISEEELRWEAPVEEKAPKKKGKGGLVVILVLEIIVLLGLVGWWIQWLL